MLGGIKLLKFISSHPDGVSTHPVSILAVLAKTIMNILPLAVKENMKYKKIENNNIYSSNPNN